MPSPEAIAACRAAGLDPDQPFAFTRWVPDTHPHLTIDYITQGETTRYVRLRDKTAGRIWAKFADPDAENDDGTIDSTFRAVLKKQVQKNNEFLQDAKAQFPNFPFDSLDFSFAGGQLIIDASGVTLAQRNALKTRLAATPYTDRVQVTP